MFYRYGCGVVGKSNFLTTFVEMMFIFILLSTIKLIGVLFTHFCEWKSFSPSSRSSSGWIVVVVTVEVGSSSMIYLLYLFSESMSNLGFDSLSLSLATNDCIE
jgi:hypothetical protein